MKIQLLCPVLILIEIYQQGLTTLSGRCIRKFFSSFLASTNVWTDGNTSRKAECNRYAIHNKYPHKVKLPVTEQFFVTLLRVYHLIGQILKSVYTTK
jgi:hypothetical protein